MSKRKRIIGAGWTVDTIYLHFEQRFKDLQTAREATAVVQKQLADTLESTAEKWRLSSNEWRGAMDDREREFVRQSKHDADIANLQKDNAALKERVDKTEGHGGGTAQRSDDTFKIISMIGTLVAILLSLIAIFRH